MRDFFFGQSGEAGQGRVCYQRGLPRLVSFWPQFFFLAMSYEILMCKNYNIYLKTYSAMAVYLKLDKSVLKNKKKSHKYFKTNMFPK